MRTSGLVLDVYDDVGGSVLKSIWPTAETFPQQVKEAQWLDPEVRDSLPDDLHALILLDGETKLRKYACVDAGNTELSIAYFLKTAHQLPEVAQQATAENLKVACSWYGVPVPTALEKVALGGVLLHAPALLGAAQGAKNNLRATNALEAQGKQVVTGKDREMFFKQADVSGTDLAPLSAPQGPPVPKKAVINKTAALPPPPEVNTAPVGGKMPERLPQARLMKPVVSADGPKPQLKEKKASLYALPAQEKYPLDDYAQVQKAAEYFEAHYKHFSPEDRREYADHLVKRASVLRIPVGEEATRYGAEGFAPLEKIKLAFELRRPFLENETQQKTLDLLEKQCFTGLEKMAGSLEAFSPKAACDLLGQFDRATHLHCLYDTQIPDPYASVYGQKTAEEAEWSDIIGNNRTTKAELTRLAVSADPELIRLFGKDFQKEFLADPVGIYRSLPLTQKKILMRMSNEAPVTA